MMQLTNVPVFIFKHMYVQDASKTESGSLVHSIQDIDQDSSDEVSAFSIIQCTCHLLCIASFS